MSDLFYSPSSSYRGRRGKPPTPLLLLLLVLVAAAGALGYSVFRDLPAASAPKATPTPAAAVSEGPSAQPAPTAPAMEAPPEIHGIYISGPVAGDPYMDTLLELIDRTELNAVVIDVKNDAGELTYRPESGSALELGACVSYIRDLPGLVSRLKERGVYTIARVVSFKDPVLAEARPDLALHRSDGTPIAEGGGPAWVNPFEPEVWDYLTEVALGAAEAGFQEVQFDYVRFPTGTAAQEADFGPAAQDMTKEEAITGFLSHVREVLHEKGVWVSADVFGTVINIKVDAQLIGQDYAAMAQAVDFICPMVYPSHYAAGSFNLDVPDRHPYATVLAALEKSKSTLFITKNAAQVRPWLQDFTATWVSGHIDYGPEELQAQIQAVYDVGCTDWLLWNANNRYTEDGLLPAQP